MPDTFQSLIRAILEDDRARAKTLIREHSQVAASGVAPNALLSEEVAHWIYIGDTALHVAAAGYRVEIAKLLLAAGADPNAAGNHRRSGPLHYAADGSPGSPMWSAERQVAMIRLLVAARADVLAADKNGATPLHRAVRTRCADAVACLLDAGADPTVRNKPGSTPFHLAVQNTGRGGSGGDKAKAAQVEIIRLFLQHGVPTDLADAKGRTVLQWAKSEGIRRLLLKGQN